MKVLDLFSGISAPSVAWHPLGWQTLAFAEIERFPSAVLQHHYPDVPNLGDITKHAEWPDYEPDVIVGGSPCQSFSVAGLRRGMDDPRGNLALTYLAVVDQYRPRWLVWENVPGVLSSNAGRDFGTFLGGLAQLGYGFAYRVLDAQFFGVPQRRRRVFVVGHSDWRCAAAVLFERHSMSGDSPPRGESGKVAPTIPSRSSAGGGLGTDFDCDGDLVARCVTTGEGTRQDYETTTLVTHTLRGEGFDASEDGTGRGTPIVTAFHPTQAVRRLTPTECERLQGFPDDYTAIPYRSKPADQCPDGPRYKAIGNSMAVPVVKWIGERIARVDRCC